jgi:hypothetical protein
MRKLRFFVDRKEGKEQIRGVRGILNLNANIYICFYMSILRSHEKAYTNTNKVKSMLNYAELAEFS